MTEREIERTRTFYCVTQNKTSSRRYKKIQEDVKFVLPAVVVNQVSQRNNNLTDSLDFPQRKVQKNKR